MELDTHTAPPSSVPVPLELLALLLVKLLFVIMRVPVLAIAPPKASFDEPDTTELLVKLLLVMVKEPVL